MDEEIEGGGETVEEARERRLKAAVCEKGSGEGEGYAWISEVSMGPFLTRTRQRVCRRCEEKVRAREIKRGDVVACPCCTWCWHRECFLPPMPADYNLSPERVGVFACSVECVNEVEDYVRNVVQEEEHDGAVAAVNTRSGKRKRTA